MMASASLRHFLDTTLGENLYHLYKTLYSLGFWTRFHIARHLPDSSVPRGNMVTRVKFRGHTVAFEHRRANDSDAHAVLQCFAEAQYNMPGGEHGQWQDRLYEEILAAGRIPLIVDCGANIGASVAWFSLRYPRAHIVAIEPAPSNCELLRRNSAGFDVEVRQAGISGEDGEGFLVNDTGESMSFRVTSDRSGLGIDLITIKTLLEQEADYIPFLLKVDIEGSERELFRGCWKELDSFPLILMELHDWLQPGANISREFFRFHVEHGRDFKMKHENVASIAVNRSFRHLAQERTSASAEATVGVSAA